MLGAVAAGPLRAQPPRPRAHEASVAIVLTTAGRATVQARYAFTGNPGVMSFEYLERPCAHVGPIRLESNGQPVPYARVATGPWVRLHDTSAVDPARSSLGYTIVYDVDVQGRDVSIPILLPAAVLATGSRRGEPIATVAIQLPAGARVTLPRMAPGGTNGRWSARMVALPSAVRVQLTTPNVECRRGTAATGESGRFTLIFWSLVATLALWVPLYLWWANRQREPA